MFKKGSETQVQATSNAPYSEKQADLLLTSYRHWTGKNLVDPLRSGLETFEALYNAPFAVASHNTAEDPIFNYGNLTAQKLFEMDWTTLLSHPSQHSAEPVNREERSRLLTRVSEQGYIDDYRGVRISSSGKRFRIEKAFIWNILDAKGDYCGQAAALYNWIEI